VVFSVEKLGFDGLLTLPKVRPSRFDSTEAGLPVQKRGRVSMSPERPIVEVSPASTQRSRPLWAKALVNALLDLGKAVLLETLLQKRQELAMHEARSEASDASTSFGKLLLKPSP